MPERIVSLGFARIERPKPDGTFEITGVPPGDYHAAAFLGPDLRNSLEPAIIEKTIARGVRVKVEEAGSVTLELKPMRWLE